MEINHITQGGLDRLMGDLNELRAQRPIISNQIAEARDKGDLSENAEYDAAKEAQGLLEMRIARLEETIAKSRVIDESLIRTDTVQILNYVTIKNLDSGKIMKYRIVSESESNLKEGKIAIQTPIAQALLGKIKGDKVEAVVPSGTLRFEILDISISM